MTRCFSMDASGWVGVNTQIGNERFGGETVLRVVKGESKLMRFDENTYARLVGSKFHDGTIEVRMLSRLLPDAPDFARGFIGIAFRIDGRDSQFESFYVRPTNAGADDPVRRAHGCQYFSFPGYTFAYFRQFGVTDYENAVDTIALGTWSHIRAVIDDDRGWFAVDDVPVLEVNGFKHGPHARGCVGLYVDIGTDGAFRNLKISPKD